MRTYQISEINDLQTQIMRKVVTWSKTRKKPISRKYLIYQMRRKKIGEPTLVNAINSLITKGYIRRAIGTSNQTYYVQLRGI